MNYLQPHDWTGFSGRVPLFPLPNVVFFPQTFLPLHVFEDRYRRLAQDALAGEGLIAMALLAPGWELDYYGTPAVHPIVCIGKVAEWEALPDGRYNILLFGLVRARVVHETHQASYRQVEVDILEDRNPGERDALARDLRQQIVNSYYSIAQPLGEPSEPQWVLTPKLPLGTLADVVTGSLGADPDQKQIILETLNPVDRAKRLVDLLDGLGRRKAKGRGPTPLVVKSRISLN